MIVCCRVPGCGVPGCGHGSSASANNPCSHSALLCLRVVTIPCRSAFGPGNQSVARSGDRVTTGIATGTSRGCWCGNCAELCSICFLQTTPSLSSALFAFCKQPFRSAPPLANSSPPHLLPWSNYSRPRSTCSPPTRRFTSARACDTSRDSWPRCVFRHRFRSETARDETASFRATPTQSSASRTMRPSTNS